MNVRNGFRPILILGLFCFGAASAVGQTIDYQIEVDTVYKEFTSEYFWAHSYLAAIPGAGKEGVPGVLIIAQKQLKNDRGDYYSGSYQLRSDDLGKTWSGPTAIPELAWTEEDGYDVALSGMVPQWHPQTGKVLAIGHCAIYDSRGTYIDRPGSQWVSYTAYDPKTDAWSRGQPLGERGQGDFGTAASCDQWLIESDGTLLVPVYVQSSQGSRWAVSVWKCKFDGQNLSVLAKGDLIARDKFRGMHEPSLAKFNGRYWLTIRTNDTAFVATSGDGLKYDLPVEWRFDDGKPLESQNTQQHWITHDEGLFLAYTRRTGDNDDIFRNRAPLFVAQIDPDRMVVLRKTERVLLPNRGVPLGNFGVSRVTPNETWVSAAECMWPYHGKPPIDRGAQGAILLSRILWSKPNAGATPPH